MIGDIRRKKDISVISARFHNSFSDIIIKTAKLLAGRQGLKKIALSGGVFQNKFLAKKSIAGLIRSGFEVFTNIENPVNDLNISLGQYYVSCNTRQS